MGTLTTESFLVIATLLQRKIHGTLEKLYPFPKVPLKPNTSRSFTLPLPPAPQRGGSPLIPLPSGAGRAEGGASHLSSAQHRQAVHQFPYRKSTGEAEWRSDLPFPHRPEAGVITILPPPQDGVSGLQQWTDSPDLPGRNKTKWGGMRQS